MEKLTAETLKKLNHGDQVYRVSGLRIKSLKYVGRMPGSPEKYLIFCDGEYLTHLYIGKDGEFKDDFYKGEYDSEFMGNILINKHIKKINSIRKIYFKIPHGNGDELSKYIGLQLSDRNLINESMNYQLHNVTRLLQNKDELGMIEKQVLEGERDHLTELIKKLR